MLQVDQTEQGGIIDDSFQPRQSHRSGSHPERREEDYRQLKDFWEIEDFKSRKYNFIIFNVVMVLFGYLFFQLYRLCPEGKAYEGKSLPVALKNYVPMGAKGVVCYRDQYFGLFELLEFMDLYAGLDPTIRLRLQPVLKKV